MELNRSPFKLFIIIALIIISGVLIWLLVTPSLSLTLFFLWYTRQRFILISIFAILLISFLTIFAFSKNRRLQQYFDILMSSKIVQLLFFFTSAFLFSYALNSYGANPLFFERASPLFIFGFLFSFEVLVFQTIIAKKESALEVSSQDQESYIKSNGRDLRLDFLRGFFVLIMIVDHIGGKSILFYVTFGGKFFTSAAEGFLLISGIVTGLVYSKIIKREGIGFGITKSARRLFSLYLIAISLSLMILFLQEHFSLWFAKGINLAQPIQPILDLLLFRTFYKNGGVLVIYFVMFLLLPYALILLEAQKTGWLVAISLIIYLANIFYPDTLFIPIDTYMSSGGIQLIFFAGLILGYNNLLEKVQHKINVRWLLITGLTFLFLILAWNFLNDQLNFPFLHLTHQIKTITNYLFKRSIVAPGRILASLVVFGFLYILITLYWKIIPKTLGWLILPLGENSLFAYTFHVIIWMVFEIISKYYGFARDSYWLNGIFQISAILFTWYFIKKQIFTPKAQNKKLYYRLPGIILLTIFAFEGIYQIPWVHAAIEPLFNLTIAK